MSCDISWGRSNLSSSECCHCRGPLTIFVGTEVLPPHRGDIYPESASGGNAPARGRERPSGSRDLPPPPPPVPANFGTYQGSQEGSRHRARSGREPSGGPVAVKARTQAPIGRQGADLDSAWGSARRDERAVEVSSRHNSVHCGACHRQSPLGSFKCGFCNFQFLTASERGRARVVLKPRDLGLDREMWYDLGRDPAREAARCRSAHYRSEMAEARRREKKATRHTAKWDENLDYRLKCSRQGMIREKYAIHVVPPWLAMNADDRPPPNAPNYHPAPGVPTVEA